MLEEDRCNGGKVEVLECEELNPLTTDDAIWRPVNPSTSPY